MSPDQIQRTYADLAELYDRQGQLRQRDWFLVLAADAAQSADRPGEADRLLGRLLSVNPHHFLKPFASFAEALRSSDVQGYVANLRRNYPPAKAAELLGTEQGKGPGGAGLAESAPAPKQSAPMPFGQQTEEPEVIFARVRGIPEEDDPTATLLPLGRDPEPAPPPLKLAPPIPFAAPKPPPEPAPPPRPRPSQRVPPPLQAPEPAPFAAEPKTTRPRKAPARPEHVPAANPLVPTSLFVLLLLLGLGLTAYTFLRPFLPPEWLP